MRELKVIERVTGARIRREEVPTVAEVEEREFQSLEERLQASLASGAWGRYRSMVEELADEHDPIDLAAAALAMVVERAAPDRRGTGSVSQPVDPSPWQAASDRPARAEMEDEQPRKARDSRSGRPPARRSETRQGQRDERDEVRSTPGRPARSARMAGGSDQSRDEASSSAHPQRPRPTSKRNPPTGGGARKGHRKGPRSSGSRDKRGRG
jgi:hypothetical protein